MNVNTSKERSFYTQGQRFAARVLFILWLLASGSPESALAAPKREMTPATTTSPGDPSLVSTPPTPLPGGKLPSASPASDEADASSQQPTVGPSDATAASCATATLEELMSREGVPDNKTFVKIFYAATPLVQHLRAGGVSQEELPQLRATSLSSPKQGAAQPRDEQLEDTLEASGFSQAVGREHCQFSHLTFHDDFPGYWLAGQFLSENKKEQRRARKLLSKHKYESQYGRTLSFMAGEVSRARGVAGIQALLRHMESDKEIVGLQHLLLQLGVVHEWLSIAQGVVEDNLVTLEKEFEIFSSLQRWFQKGLEHVRSPNRRHNSEGEKLLNSLTEKASWAVATHAPKLFQLLLNTTKDRNEDENVCEAARKAFVKVLKATPCKVPATIPGLIEAAKDQHWDVREAAIEALAQVAQVAPDKVSNIVKILKQAAGDQDKNTRQAAIKAIGKVAQAALDKVADIIEILKQAAGDQDKNTRQAAIEALGKVPYATPEQVRGIIPTLKNAAKESQWHIQRAAIEALAQVAQKSAPSETEVIIKTLYQAAQEEDVDVQEAALAQMAKISGKVPDAMKILLEFAQERGCDVRLPAIEALAQIAFATSNHVLDIIQTLRQAAKDEEAAVRQAAIEALAQIALAAPSQVPDIIPILQNAVQDRDCDVRQAAIEALGKIAHTTSSHVSGIIQTLLQAAKDEEAAVRLPAIEALGKIAHTTSNHVSDIIQTLEDAAKDPDCDVQRAAINTLIQVAYRAPLEATKIINTLCQFAQDKNYDARELAIEALAQVALADTKQATDTIPTLHQVAQDEDVNVREAALEALGKVAHATSSQTPTIIQTLLEAAKGEDPNVCPTAIEALAQLALADTSQVSGIIEILKEAAQAESTDVRLSALKALEEVARVATSKAQDDIQDDIIKILEDAAISSQELNQEQLLYHVLDHCRAAAIEALPQVALANNDKALKVITILKNTIEDEDDEDGDMLDLNLIRPAVVARKATLKALAQATRAVKEEAPRILSILRKAAKDEDANVREAAIEALEQVALAATDEAPDIIEILKEAAYASVNQDPDTIRATIAALEQVAHGVSSQAPTIIPILIATARDQYTCKDARDAAVDALGKISLQILLQSYWVIQDPRLIPYITTGLYHTPLVTQKPSQNQQQVVTLYATAGQPSQCSQPQEAVQHFMCLIKPEAGQAKKDLKYHIQYLEMLQARLQILGLDNNHPDVAASLNNVGGAYYVSRNYTQALEYGEEALTMRKALYGASTNHPSIADSLANMGLVHHALGKHQQALEYGKEALTMRKALYGASAKHPSIADSLTNVGTAYQSFSKHAESFEHYRQAFEMQKVLYGDSHPRVADSLVCLGTYYLSSLGKPQEALQYYEQALTIFKPNLSLQEEEIDQ